ncbi:thermonuclease family protein [Novosphingobium tardum]|uniref:Thermonuclease family protein n=1 Tax=Novosphingobium tardum TaxID=1538021 RepID=A0ABV8RLA8_9SPHN
MSDVPPPPPGFSLDGPRKLPRVRSAISDIPPPPEGFKLDGDAIDGDTLSTTNGPHLRLYGVDAPETGQQGWDRQGQPVPIGANAKAAVDTMVDPFGAIGNLRGYSYGRLVAPVTQGGQDVGQRMVRAGNALAEPSYMKREPDRAQNYMEGERLARENRLGVHGVYAQTPSDFRHNPDPAPTRETVARFWDTPTPMAGLRPEIEKGYQALLHSGTPDQILAYAKDNYFTLNPRDVAAFVKDRDAHKSVDYAVTYKHTPKPLTNQGDGAVGAAVRGVGDGVLPNLLDEAGAVVDTLGVTPDRENVFNSDRRLADIWANNQQQNEAITGYDALAHPYVRGAGEIVGGLALPMGKVETAADLARWGAGYGFLGGFGQGDTLPDRLTSGTVGLGEGVATTVLGTKALEYAAPRVSGWFRKMPGGGGAPDGSVAIPNGVPRSPDRIDVGPIDYRQRPELRSAIQTSYPGPVVGRAPSLEDVLPEVQSWAARQGEGVMLHGSSNPDIDAFDPYAKSGYGLFGQGTYLTDNPSVAAGYSSKGLKRAGDLSGRSIYAVEPRVTNPLDMDGPADVAAWSKVAGDYADFTPGMTNEQAYRAVEEGLINHGDIPKWEGAEIMSDTVRNLGHDGITHIGGGRYGDGPSHRVVIALDPEQTIIRDRLPLGEMLKAPMRDRDWIDIANVPPPPPGFKLDAQAMAAEPGPAATSDLRRPDYLFTDKPTRMDAPLTEAQVRAASERIEPRDVLPIASNEVGSVEEAARIDAGRYEPAKPVDEASTLARRTVTAANGRPLPKRGPLDLVTWLRANGGVKDEGGDLTSMGIGNAPRDLDFARGEQRFGKLIDNTHGMSLDDAAFKAWEAGYLPQGDRPTINRFIEALGATHSGRERFFHPDDLHEVDTFDATRADRMALEEQLADGPVYNDRSVPADESQPFPPPQAYEDWPSGGPDFAGNIRLEKLDSPQDIKRALTTVQDRVGFDAATRGRVTQAETERLASELGMTPDALLSRRKGQALNAEEALAARQILAKSANELVNMARKVQQLENPGDDAMAAFRRAWMRHAAIQEQVAGATAEAGRALQQFRMMADSRAINKDVLSAMVDHGGGAERIKQAAETLLDAVEAGPGVFNTVADKLAKPRFRDKITEVYINSLLSGPQTHVVNTVSNTLTALGQIPEHAVAAGFGGVRRMAGRGEDAVLGSEVGARAFGLLQGMKEGLGLFARSLRTGEPVDLVSKVETQQFKAVSGIKGEIVRLPTRFLMAEDEFFKGVARRMELNGLAVRQARKEGLRGAAAKARIADLSANPPDEMLAKSMDYARYLTFQRKLGPGAAHVAAITQDWPILKPFLPFVRTPTNLLKFATERSPAAPMLREWRADFKAGGARRDLAVARMLVGTGAGMAVYQYALAGRISGSPPTDPAKAKLLYADGWQPYSIKLGDKWYSYKRLDPFSTTLGVAADMALLPQGMSEHQLNEGAPLLVASIMGNLASKTWLSGLSDIIEALDDPERNADKLIQRLAGAVVVPSAVAQMARTVDPVARETDGVGEYIQSRVPGVSDNLLPRRDVWGQPITNEGGVGPDMLSPIWQSTQKSDPVNRALLDAGVSVGLPQRKIGDRQLTPQEYDSYQAKAGAIAYPRLRSLVGSKAWSAMDDETRQDSVGDVMKGARKAARTSLFGSAKAPASTASKAVPPPPGFSVDGASGGLNLYRDLQSAIPGVRFTSGFRTPAYQADMKRRGYHPADNSGHLDGSSFDMLPPPGKSLGWLRGAVKQFQPDARLLNEGDHLHATFPGYYGAPAIGGAKAAGLRNPLAGMPPPPPGFKIDGR